MNSSNYTAIKRYIKNNKNNIPTIKELKIERAKRSYTEWMKYMWKEERKPFKIGRPTTEISNTIDWCLERYRNGISSTVLINVPPRMGKSNAVSRYLAPRFLGEFPDEEVLVVSHTFEKTKEFNRFSRDLMEGQLYRDIYPNVVLDKQNKSVKEWGIKLNNKHVVGKSQYAGFQGGIAGRGSALLIIDDYLKNRQDAESQVIRNRIFEEFQSGLLSRLEDVYILFILATRWHSFDLVGRILEEKKIIFDKKIILPALSNEYKSKTLFPEKFSLERIKLIEKQIGQYAFSSLYQQEPTLRGGNRFVYKNIIEVDEEPEMFKNAPFVRCWDLASSEDKGDWTVGPKGKFIIKNELEYIYIDDIKRFQKTSVYRDEIIKSLAESERIRIGIECYGPYKDTYNNIKHLLRGVCTIKGLTPPGSKEVKAEPLEPIIEYKRFFINKKNCRKWLKDLIKEFREFPASKTDDIVDAIVLIYWIHRLARKNKYMNIPY